MSSGRINFIVEADEPALFFESRAAAEKSLESIDAETGVYPIAFDRSGIVYDVIPAGNRVSLVRRPGVRPDPERLKQTLRRFLLAVGAPFSEAATLEQLLVECEPYVGPPRTWPRRNARTPQTGRAKHPLSNK